MLSFDELLLRYSKSIQESPTSIRVSLEYNLSVLDDFYRILQLAEENNIQCAVEICYSNDNRYERFIYNFNTSDEGIDRLVSRLKANHNKIRRIIADASFLSRQDKLHKIKELIQILLENNLHVKVDLFISKSSFEMFVHKKANLPKEIDIHYWFDFNSFIKQRCSSIENLFHLLWSDGFPIIISDLPWSINCNFCCFSPKIDSLNIERIKNGIRLRQLFTKLVPDLRKSEVGMRILAHFALLSEDEKSSILFEKLPSSLALGRYSTLPFPESQYLEFKLKWKSDFKTQIAGFANAGGGMMILGIDDKTREIKGTDDTRDSISNDIGKISPLPLFHIWDFNINVAKLICIVVETDTNNRIFRLPKGETPVRVDSSIQYIHEAEKILEFRNKLLSSMVRTYVE